MGVEMISRVENSSEYGDWDIRRRWRIFGYRPLRARQPNENSEKLRQAENTYGVRENYFVHCVDRPPEDIA